MSFLTEEWEDSFKFKGETFHVNLAFDNILLLFEMFNDESLANEEKIVLSLEMLVNEYEKIRFDSPEEFISLYQYVMKEFLGYDSEETNEESDKKKTYDFEKDAELIYASFYAAYHIDLIEQKGKLHWRKFITLMRNLDDKTAFKKVVEIRTMKVPKTDKHNHEQVAQIRKLKQIYSLEDTSGEDNLQNAFSEVGAVFRGMKKAGE